MTQEARVLAKDFPVLAAALRHVALSGKRLDQQFFLEKCEEVLGAEGVDEADLISCDLFLGSLSLGQVWTLEKGARSEIIGILEQGPRNQGGESSSRTIRRHLRGSRRGIMANTVSDKMDKSITLTQDEQDVLKKILSDLEMIPGGSRLDSDAEDEALWSFIEKVRAL